MLRVVLGLAVSAVALVVVLRQVQWEEMARAWRSAEAGLLLVGVLVYPWRLAVVAVRWRELLGLYGPPPGFGVRLRATSVGYLFNNLLPLRSGEVIRGALVVREGVTIKAAASSLLLEKVVDLWALVAIALIAGSAFLRAEPTLLRALHWLALVAGLGLAGFLVVALLGSKRAADAWGRRATSRATRLAARLACVVVETGQLFRRPRALFLTLGATAVNWGIEALFYLLVARALGMPLTVAGVLFMVAVIGLGLTVPTTAGGIGLSQYLAMLVLRVQGVDVSMAAAYSLLSYAVGFLCINGVGLSSLLVDALRRGSAAAPGESRT